MARGFSHSGRSGGGGGGRSSGGGGFSFGGSGRSDGGGGSRGHGRGGGGGEHHHRPRRPLHIPMFGRTVIISTGARSVFSVFLTILVMAVVVLFTFAGTISEDSALIKEQQAIIKKCEEYSEDFEEISEKALRGDAGYYLVDVDISDYDTISYYDDDPTDVGIYVTDVWYDGQKQYFIVYEFYDINGDLWNDSTFAEFDLYDLSDLRGTLKIAYKFKGNELWSINAGYTLEGNTEYLYNKNIVEGNIASNNFNITVTVVAGVVVLAIVIGCVLYVVKQYKKAKKEEAVQDAKNAAEIAEAEAKAEEAQAKADRHNRFCMYCGAQIPAEDDVCPACGSRQFGKD